MLRDRGAGPTLLVSPLLSLMRNQIEAGERGGVRSARITRDNNDRRAQNAAAPGADPPDLPAGSPGRFASPPVPAPRGTRAGHVDPDVALVRAGGLAEGLGYHLSYWLVPIPGSSRKGGGGDD